MPTSEDSFDLHKLKYESLTERPSKVQLTDLGRPGIGTGTFEDLLDGLPTVLAAQSFKQLRDAIVTAYDRRSHVLAALGAM